MKINRNFVIMLSNNIQYINYHYLTFMNKMKICKKRNLSESANLKLKKK